MRAGSRLHPLQYKIEPTQEYPGGERESVNNVTHDNQGGQKTRKRYKGRKGHRHKIDIFNDYAPRDLDNYFRPQRSPRGQEAGMVSNV